MSVAPRSSLEGSKGGLCEVAMDVRQKIKWVYSSVTAEELGDRYDSWANDYECDLEEEGGYVAPKRTVETVVRYLPKHAKILDAGVGTGLIGKMLREEGYHNLEGIDLSRRMLEKAATKKAYTKLYRKVLGKPLGFPSNTFDGVVSVGVLTYGHAPSSSLDEMIRITKPGGHVIFSLVTAFYDTSDFKQKMASLEASGGWVLVSCGKAFQPLPDLEPETHYRLWVYKVRSYEAGKGQLSH